MLDRSILRRGIGLVTIALGGLGLVVPLYMVLTRIEGGRGEGLTGTYFETASLLQIPMWLIVGFVLVVIGFSFIPDDEPIDADEE